MRMPVEEPRRVVRGIRGQVAPVLEIVVREQADIGHEDARVDVDAVHDVEVVAAVHLADVPERGLEVELAPERAVVVARDDDGAHPELGHQAPARPLPVEVSAEAHELERHPVVPRQRRRPDHRVIDGVVLREGVVDVEEEAPGEILRIEERVLLAVRAVQPREIAEGEGLARRGLFRLSSGFFSSCSCASSACFFAPPPCAPRPRRQSAARPSGGAPGPPREAQAAPPPAAPVVKVGWQEAPRAGQVRRPRQRRWPPS